MRVLIVVGDDAERASLMADLLQAGFAASAVGSAQDARALLRDERFDVTLLDSFLTDVDALPFCAELCQRYGSRMVIMFLCNPSERTQRITALELGADDVVVKPYSIEELLARIDAHRLRHLAYSA